MEPSFYLVLVCYLIMNLVVLSGANTATTYFLLWLLADILLGIICFVEAIRGFRKK